MAPWISDGRPVELHVDAYRDRTFTGKVTRISPVVNTATRAFPFEAVVPNADAALKPGTFARVHVESGKVDDVLTLPYAALQYRYGVNRVFVVKGDRLALRELQVGERLGDRIEIASGVKEGEQVAVTDVDTLADGALVAVDQVAGGQLLSEFCVRRPVSATMLVMSLVVLGIFSFRDLGVDLFPKADPATVSVSLLLPGASPDELSTSVVEPMEEAISGVSGIDEIQARISEGKAWITVRFVLERDLNDAANDVREKVAGAIQTRPARAAAAGHHQGGSRRRSGPLAHRVVERDEPPDAHRAHRQADQPRHPDGQRRRRGQPGRRPRARNPHRRGHREARSYGLSMTQVRDAIVAENVEIPGGTVEQGKGQLLLRTLGRVDAAQDFNNIVVATKGGTPIRISDIGYAEDSFQRPTSAVWLGDTPAVMLDVRRAMGENTVAVIEGVRAKLDDHPAVAAAVGDDHGHPRRLAATSTPRSPRSRSTCSSARSSPPSW